MRFVAIVCFCTVMAVAYGILHDQVTARVCVEYFTIGHPRVIPSEDPTALGLVWGVIATWWVGFSLGIPLALAARAGDRPRWSVAELVRPVLILLAVMAVSAASAGLLGWLLARAGLVSLPGGLEAAIPADRRASFLADLWAHSTSYLVGFVGGVVVILWVWHARGRGAPFHFQSSESSMAGTGPARAGIFLYAANLEQMASFYEAVLAMKRLKSTPEMVILSSPDIQLVVHLIPPHIAETIVIESPPRRRENTALKFFFSVDSLSQAEATAAALGGSVDHQAWEGPGFIVRNACDPEGNIFQVREWTA